MLKKLEENSRNPGNSRLPALENVLWTTTRPGECSQPGAFSRQTEKQKADKLYAIAGRVFRGEGAAKS